MTALIKYEPEDTLVEMEIEQALSKIILGSKKDPNQLLNELALIEFRYLLELSESKKKAQVLRARLTTYLDLKSLEIQRSGFNFKPNLTSAIGNLANRSIYQDMYPAIMPWPMTLTPTNEAVRHENHVEKNLFIRKKN